MQFTPLIQLYFAKMNNIDFTYVCMGRQEQAIKYSKCYEFASFLHIVARQQINIAKKYYYMHSSGNHGYLDSFLMYILMLFIDLIFLYLRPSKCPFAGFLLCLVIVRSKSVNKISHNSNPITWGSES